MVPDRLKFVGNHHFSSFVPSMPVCLFNSRVVARIVANGCAPLLLVRGTSPVRLRRPPPSKGDWSAGCHARRCCWCGEHPPSGCAGHPLQRGIGARGVVRAAAAGAENIPRPAAPATPFKGGLERGVSCAPLLLARRTSPVRLRRPPPSKGDWSAGCHARRCCGRGEHPPSGCAGHPLQRGIGARGVMRAAWLWFNCM